MILIDEADILDLSELATMIREQAEIHEAAESPDERVNAEETLNQLITVLGDLGYRIEMDEYAWDEVADRLDDLARNEPSLINESYFTDYIEYMVKDVYPKINAPDFLVIDWDTTAEGLKDDYTRTYIGNVAYYIRRD